jgi:hypothetical protein
MKSWDVLVSMESLQRSVRVEIQQAIDHVSLHIILHLEVFSRQAPTSYFGGRRITMANYSPVHRRSDITLIEAHISSWHQCVLHSQSGRHRDSPTRQKRHHLPRRTLGKPNHEVQRPSRLCKHHHQQKHALVFPLRDVPPSKKQYVDPHR